MTITNNWYENAFTDIAEQADFEVNKSKLFIRNLQDLTSKISELISHLIETNFEKLIWILYRIDVDEEKAKRLLHSHLPAEAPGVLAELIVQRQLKKEEIKQQFKFYSNKAEIDDDLLL